jgi:hypothetical protein
MKDGRRRRAGVTLGCGTAAEVEECGGPPPAAVTRLLRWRVRRGSRGEARRRREVEEQAGGAADVAGRGGGRREMWGLGGVWAGGVGGIKI